MSRKFIPFTKIGQYRQTVRDVQKAAQYQGMDADGNAIMDRTATLPTMEFKGTVKLHGTNAGVGSDDEGLIWAQSRKNVITVEKDNAGFAFFVDSHKDVFDEMHTELRTANNLTDERVIIFGEWCGGNIQKGVALNGLDKMFVIFAVKIAPLDDEADNYYLTEDKWEQLKSPENKIYNINDFESYTVKIDFNEADRARNEMIEIMQKVEKECPVGKAFGRGDNDEDNTTGEGNVWVGWGCDGNRYIFKVKGEEHSASKVKTLAPVDIEKLNSISEFIEFSVTENRLNQAIEQVFTTESKTPDVKSTGDFLRWVVNDITAEEMDTMVENNLEPKDVNKHISAKSRKWFHEFLNKEAGL